MQHFPTNCVKTAQSGIMLRRCRPKYRNFHLNGEYWKTINYTRVVKNCIKGLSLVLNCDLFSNILRVEWPPLVLMISSTKICWVYYCLTTQKETYFLPATRDRLQGKKSYWFCLIAQTSLTLKNIRYKSDQ